MPVLLITAKEQTSVERQHSVEPIGRKGQLQRRKMSAGGRELLLQAPQPHPVG